MSVFDLELAAKALVPKDLLNEASSLHLAIHIGDGLVEAAVADVASGEMLWSRAFKPDFFDGLQSQVDFILERNWAERVFRKCTLTYDSRCFTLVPAPFFTEQESARLLAYNTGKEIRHVDHVYLPGADAHLIYEIPAEIRSLIKKFPNVRILPSVFVLALNAESTLQRRDQQIQMYVSKNYMLLCVHLAGKLQLLNYFDIQGETDVLYFLSNAVMRSVMDPEDLILEFADCAGMPGLERLLKTYYSNVICHGPKTMMQPGESFVYFTSLQIKCV